VLQLLFSLNCLTDILSGFEVNEHVQAVRFCESLNRSTLMLEDSHDKIIGNADIQHTASVVCHYVHVVHALSIPAGPRLSGTRFTRPLAGVTRKRSLLTLKTQSHIS
jgi:hypothetical protein